MSQCVHVLHHYWSPSADYDGMNTSHWSPAIVFPCLGYYSVVCNVEKGMVRTEKKVIKQMLSKKKKNAISHWIKQWFAQESELHNTFFPQGLERLSAHVHLPPGKQSTPLGSHELFCLLPSSVRYSMSSLKPVDCEVKIQPIFTPTPHLQAVPTFHEL